MVFALVPDKYKGCLTAEQVGQAMALGVSDFNPQASCVPFFISDGGDGFLHSLMRYQPNLQLIDVQTVDALHNPLIGSYLWNEETETAYFELASASGLATLEKEKLDVIRASTYGTGIEIREAIERGAGRIIIGLGGSATNDLGLGIARALGFRFIDKYGNQLNPDLLQFEQVAEIVAPAEYDRNIEWNIVNDVINPLLGPEGATYTYGPQKGVSVQLLEPIESGISHLAGLMEDFYGGEIRNVPGSGAAGGTAFGLMALFGASSVQGAPFLLEMAGFQSLLNKKDVRAVITGEGKMDSQTAFGKLIQGVTSQAEPYKVPVLAICGAIEKGWDWKNIGLKSARAISDVHTDPQYSFDHAEALIREQTTQLLQELFDH